MAAKVLLLAGACNALVAPSQPTKTKLRAATLEEVERIPTPAFGKTFGDDVSKLKAAIFHYGATLDRCLLYTSPRPRDGLLSRMPSSA